MRKPIHLILKSEKGGARFHFSPRSPQLKKLVKKTAERYQIKIYRYALNWTHIHFVLQIPSREAYVNFARYLTSQIVRQFSRQRKTSLKGLFSLRPFTRIIHWGKDFVHACEYVLRNISQSFSYGEEMIRLQLNDWRAGPISPQKEERGIKWRDSRNDLRL